ncbi:hypothetical protein MTO96_018319 [Rhipicephalus appendiculatus]
MLWNGPAWNGPRGLLSPPHPPEPAGMEEEISPSEMGARRSLLWAGRCRLAWLLQVAEQHHLLLLAR